MQRAKTTPTWEAAFAHWCEPFLAALSREAQRRWAPVYLKGLLGPGERKSVEPMAARVCPADVQQLHHFVAAAPWATEPLERVLAERAQRLVGGPGAVLIIDDTTFVKQGRHSVGVARQYCGALGKRANCQTLVSLTLAKREVPVALALRLYLPEEWAADLTRCRKAGVPEGLGFYPRWRIALHELDRVRAAGVTFDLVLSDAGYGTCAEFRRGLSARALTWAAGILSTQKVYPTDVRLAAPKKPPTGRPQRHPVPSAPSVPAEAVIAALGPTAFRRLSWRRGTKGPLAAGFAACRARAADGPLMARAQHLPGEAAWLVCERRSRGAVKYYLTNHPASATLRELARAIKARWSCEQAHQQMREELGLDHYEGRSWRGLHHHVLLTMIAFAFLQHLRLRGKNWCGPPRATARAIAPGGAGAAAGAARARRPAPVPAVPGPHSRGTARVKVAD
jgi:SRSO17 transposase